MADYKVLVTARSFGSKDESVFSYLEENGCEVKKIAVEDLEKEISDADAIIAGLEVYDENLLSKASQLKVISRYGVGYDKVDLKASKNHNVKVTITPGANGDSVADMACALILSCARNVPFMDQKIKEGNSSRKSGIELDGKTLGIVGAGRIGKGVGRRLKGFGMNLLCYDQYIDEEFAKEYDAKYVDFDTLVKESDVITIHSPLTEETRYLFNKDVFKKMKKNAILVNTARGGIIQEEDLYEALVNGEIYGAGLDVTENESSYDQPLAKLENCIMTPHAAAATAEASIKMSRMASENVVEVLTTGSCKNEVMESL